MGEPQRSGSCGKGGVTEPFRFGVATVGVQRQVDRPALEPDAGKQRGDSTKIIGPQSHDVASR